MALPCEMSTTVQECAEIAVLESAKHFRHTKQNNGYVNATVIAVPERLPLFCGVGDSKL